MERVWKYSTEVKVPLPGFFLVQNKVEVVLSWSCAHNVPTRGLHGVHLDPETRAGSGPQLLRVPQTRVVFGISSLGSRPGSRIKSLRELLKLVRVVLHTCMHVYVCVYIHSSPREIDSHLEFLPFSNNCSNSCCLLTKLFAYWPVAHPSLVPSVLMALFHCVVRLGSARLVTARLGLVCISTAV